MTKKLFILAISLTVMACQSLTFQEQRQLAELKYKGITIDTPAGGWEKPAKPMAAGLLSLLPGIGNFYLGNGRAAQSEQNLYGFANLLTWPLSILWAVPETIIDADTINRRDMLLYYQFDDYGKEALQNRK